MRTGCESDLCVLRRKRRRANELFSLLCCFVWAREKKDLCIGALVFFDAGFSWFVVSWFDAGFSWFDAGFSMSIFERVEGKPSSMIVSPSHYQKTKPNPWRFDSRRGSFACDGKRLRSQHTGDVQ